MESSLVNDSIDDVEDNCPVHRHGYCDTMKCIARFADKKPQSETEFPTSEMLQTAANLYFILQFTSEITRLVILRSIFIHGAV